MDLLTRGCRSSRARASGLKCRTYWWPRRSRSTLSCRQRTCSSMSAEPHHH